MLSMMCMFNEIVIKNAPIKKIRPFFVFMEEVTCLRAKSHYEKAKSFNKMISVNFMVTVNLTLW